MYNPYKEIRAVEGHRQDLLREAEQHRILPKRARNQPPRPLASAVALAGSAVGLIFVLIAVL